MAFLSAGRPDWVIELGSIAGQLITRIEAARPGLSHVYVRPDLKEVDLVITIPGVADGDRGGAMWTTAVVVSELWVDWLAQDEVGAVIFVPGLSARADSQLMLELASGGMSREQWMSRATIEIRQAT